MNASGELGRRISLGSLYVLLFLLPFSKSAIELMFGGLLLGWALERWDPRTRRGTIWLRAPSRPLLLALATFLGVCILSIAVSRHMRQSLEGLIGKWLEYLLFFVFVADLGAQEGVGRRCAAVLSAGSVFVILEAVWQEIFGRGLFRGYRLMVFDRMTGPYENPIDLATYLMVVLLLLVGVTSFRRGRGVRGLLWLLAVAVLLCLGRTLAFGAWLSLGVGLAWLLWREPRVRRQAMMTGAAVLLAAGFFILRRGDWSLVSFSDVGTKDRVFMWQTALRMIQDRPLLGHGINTFMANYLDYWVGGERQPRYAHNSYLQMAAETGLIGLAAFLWLLWLLRRAIERGLRAGSGADDRGLLAGLAAALLAFLIQAGYDTNFYAMRQVAMFWVLAGLAVGLSERVSTDASGAKSAPMTSVHR